MKSVNDGRAYDLLGHSLNINVQQVSNATFLITHSLQSTYKHVVRNLHLVLRFNSSTLLHISRDIIWSPCVLLIRIRKDAWIILFALIIIRQYLPTLSRHLHEE